MKALRDIYEEHLKFLAEKSRFSLDEKLAASLPAVHRLLYRADNDWIIIDFKTDEARAIISREQYNLQVTRYARAVATQLNVKAKTRLVFLNVNGEVKVYE